MAVVYKLGENVMRQSISIYFSSERSINVMLNLSSVYNEHFLHSKWLRHNWTKCTINICLINTLC